MKCTLLVVGKLKKGPLVELEREFLKRLKPLASLSVIEVAASRSGTVEQRKLQEGKALLAKVPSGAALFVLDEHGKEFTSAQFSARLQELALDGTGSVCIVIGGPYGLSEEVIGSARVVMRLSSMTFTAGMARVIAVEQFYRAMAIWKGIPYHKE